MSNVECLIIALLLDAFLGEPNWLWSRIPHPATLMGRMISWGDRRFNLGRYKVAKGTLFIFGPCCVAALIGVVLSKFPDFRVLEIIIAAILLAQNSLVQHVKNVASGLSHSLKEGRRQVSYIVGRDTANMDPSAVSRSAIESGAESFSDGVIAPAFWFLVFGLPGILVYKVVNTADSMIGYRTPKHEQFGKAAARFDDILNWIPARISGLLVAATSMRRQPFKIMFQDAKHHRSPNAGWPESAMAGCLKIALSGPRSYDGKMSTHAYLNKDGRKNLTQDDVLQSTRVLWGAWFIFLTICIAYVIANIIAWLF